MLRHRVLSLVTGVAAAVLMVLAYRWVVRRTEHRPVHELAPAGAGADVGRGLGIGVAVFAAEPLIVHGVVQRLLEEPRPSSTPTAGGVVS